LQVFMVARGVMVSAGVSAQNKVGYIRINDIVGLMPELAPEKVKYGYSGSAIRKGFDPALYHLQAKPVQR
jgi:hypothetical protein